MEQEAKPGWKSTEFWLTTLASLLGFGVVLGLVSPEDATAVSSHVTEIIGAVTALLPIGAYTLSRGKAKGVSGIDINALGALLAAQSTAPVVVQVESGATVKPEPTPESAG